MEDETKNYAVALAVLDTEQVTADSRILIGVRRPETNRVHPNVISVPTERIPECLYRAIAAEVSPTLPLIPCYEHPGASPVGYCVKSLFAQKLGLADAMEHRHVGFSAASRMVFSGTTPVIAESDVETPWTMVLIAVSLDTRLCFLPFETSSYSWLRWVYVDELLAAVDGGGVLGFGGHRLGGLCITSTATWLRDSLPERTSET